MLWRDVVRLPALVLLLLASECSGSRGLGVRRQLQEAEGPSSVAIIYNGGLQDGWKSWSWGTKYINEKDPAQPMKDSTQSLCVQLAPYGALSLRSNVPFSLKGMLGLYMRATPAGALTAPSGEGGNVTAAAGPAPDGGARNGTVGDLELQFESSAPGAYTISRSQTVRQILGSDAGGRRKLAAMQRGEWVALNATMPDFIRNGTAAAQYDRVTLGSCLQNFELCTTNEMPDIAFCIDKLVMVTTA